VVKIEGRVLNVMREGSPKKTAHRHDGHGGGHDTDAARKETEAGRKRSKMKTFKIGILSLQGDLEEHASMMRRALDEAGISGSVVGLRRKTDVAGLDALVIPGGESTVMAKLVHLHGLEEEIKKLARLGVPIMGTCAGLVLLARSGCDEVEKTGQRLLGLIDITVERNAFGRQKESFEADIDIPVLGEEKYHGVFIRAPAIGKAGAGVKVLAEYEGKAVAAQEGNILVLAFHPELSGDLRMHEYFLKLLKDG